MRQLLVGMLNGRDLPRREVGLVGAEGLWGRGLLIRMPRLFLRRWGLFVALQPGCA